MPEVYSKIISYMVAVLEFFIAPVILVSLVFNISIQMYITSSTVRFVDECCQTGYIDPSNYKIYAEKIYRFGAKNITITHSSRIAYPDEAGSYQDAYFDYNTEDVLSVLFPATGDEQEYNMKATDTLTIQVQGSGLSYLNGMMFAFAGGSSENNHIVVNYSGMVANKQEK